MWMSLRTPAIKENDRLELVQAAIVLCIKELTEYLRGDIKRTR